MVGAVGIEFAVHLISPADSIALVSSLLPKRQLVGRFRGLDVANFPGPGMDRRSLHQPTRHFN
jgi:hypothetical protein